MGGVLLEAIVRPVAPPDRGSLVALVARAMDAPWSEDQIAGALSGTGARGWVAELTAEGLVGFVLARRVLDGLEIDLVGVDPAQRRRGLARRLLARVLRDESAEGLAEARLELADSNTPALQLYRALGFVVVGRRPRYYPDGADALLLTWRTPPGTQTADVDRAD